MGQISISLGQDVTLTPPGPQEPADFIPVDPMPALQDAYDGLQRLCLERFSQSFCDSFLPRRPILPREEPGLLSKWYVWAGIGFLAGKLL